MADSNETRESFITRELNKLGIGVDKQHFTGDSAFPTEYTISIGNVRALGPTFDMALLDFISKLIKTDYRAIETALQALAGNVNNLRTEMLVVKGMLVAQEEQH